MMTYAIDCWHMPGVNHLQTPPTRMPLARVIAPNDIQSGYLMGFTVLIGSLQQM